MEGEIKGSVKGGAHQPVRHESGHKHVSGAAVYIDDIPAPANCLQIAVGTSPHAHARVLSLDLSEVWESAGVVDVVCRDDIPGENDVSPVMGDDPMFAAGRDGGLVEYEGQVIFAVAATSLLAAREAVAKARIAYEPLDAIITIEEALASESLLEPPYVMGRGDPDAAIEAAPRRLSGRFEVGGQEHFYLEGQAALAEPGEDEEVTIHSSTQHPSEIQHCVAKVLGISNHAVTVIVRRMGGGFGGKESQGNLPAAIAALIAKRTGRPAKLLYDRDEDFRITGKRHDIRIDYQVGFDEEGRILGVVMDQAMRCGMSFDLSIGVCDRAMFHADNAYHLPAARITSYRCKTNTASSTAFRGFGGPQGVIAIERIVDEIAFALSKDPLEIRRLNFYPDMGAESERSLTHYGMVVEDSVLNPLVEELAEKADYQARRAAVRAFNSGSPVLRKGLALTPVKFGISFTVSHLNQAGALVHIYNDGSIYVNHGGTEMGQGLFIKVAQVVAEEFQVDLARVKISATNTSQVPNTSPTAASSGSDVNGMAARAACQTLKKRLTEFASTRWGVTETEVIFKADGIHVGTEVVPFNKLIKDAYLARVSLSSTGYYATPKITWDRATGTGRPFFYFAYGAAISEVTLDRLTGEYKINCVDILHDCGRSLNPVIDLGQIEGGFVQGAGWLTSEELVYGSDGALKTHAPSTYKIPTASDSPADFRVEVWGKGRNFEDAIYRSKAVGEPPLMHGISVFLALSDAIASLSDYQIYPALDAPATPERVLSAINRQVRSDAS